MSTLPWNDIPNGRDAIPVSEDPSTPHRFMWALHNKRHYTLLYLVSQSDLLNIDMDLPSLQSVDIYFTPSSPCYLAVSLLDSSFADIFLDLCNDLISSTRQSTTREEGLANLVNRCWRWQSLLYRKGSPLLSLQEQQGLFAELSFLSDHLIPSLGLSRSLEMWQGPYGSYHDFVSPPTDIEVKSFRAFGTPKIRISSEHQLEHPLDKTLYLACYSLAHDQTAGCSISSKAEQISSLLAGSAPAICGLFYSLLEEAGFSWTHNYENSKWTIQSLLCYKVRNGFPSINRSSLDSAIVHAEYDLNPLLLADFAADIGALVASLL